MIKKYLKFVEAFVPDKLDPPEIASSMNTTNNDEKNIKEYNAKKATISSLYMNYKTEDELVNGLFSNKFITTKTDITKLKFNNPLLEMWARVCQKNRELVNIENDIKKYQDQIKGENDNLKGNPSSKESITNNIKLIQSQIQQKTTEINQKKTEIMNMGNDITKQLKVMSDRLTKSKKDINVYNQGKYKK
jgi:chromosome segregation ATPase